MTHADERAKAGGGGGGGGGMDCCGFYMQPCYLPCHKMPGLMIAGVFNTVTRRVLLEKTKRLQIWQLKYMF